MLWLALLLGLPPALAQPRPQGDRAADPARQALRQGRQALRQGRYERAVERLTASLALAENPEARRLLLRAKLGSGECEAGLESGFPRAQWDAQLVSGTAACFARRGDWSEALYWQEEVELLQGTPVAKATRALYLARLGDQHAADRLFGEIEDNAPQWTRRKLLLAGLAVDRGDHETAQALIDELSLAGEEGRGLDLLRAEMALDAGDLIYAVRLAEDLARESPRDPRTLALLAEGYRRLGLLDLSRDTLDQRADAALRPRMNLVRIRLLRDEGQAVVTLARAALTASPYDLEALATLWYATHDEALRALYERNQDNPYRTLGRL